MRIIKYSLYLIFSLIIITFCLSNKQPVTFHLFPSSWEIELPLFLFFILTLITGIIIGRVIGLFKEFELYVRLKRLAKTSSDKNEKYKEVDKPKLLKATALLENKNDKQ